MAAPAGSRMGLESHALYCSGRRAAPLLRALLHPRGAAARGPAGGPAARLVGGRAPRVARAGRLNRESDGKGGVAVAFLAFGAWAQRPADLARGSTAP